MRKLPYEVKMNLEKNAMHQCSATSVPPPPAKEMTE
jgi:hypothetical protein